MIEGTYLGVQHMSTKNGGRGGTIVNVASLGGKESYNGDSKMVRYGIFQSKASSKRML